MLFGIGYGTASLSCTLPIFLAATGSAVTGGVLSFLAYAAGMGTILTALAVAAALSQQGLARALRRLVPYVNRASGALLLLAGGYVVYYWAFFLLPGSDTRTSGRSLINQGETLSSRAATWLGSDSGQTVATVILGVLAALILWALARWILRPARPAVARTTPSPADERHAQERGAHGAASHRV